MEGDKLYTYKEMNEILMNECAKFKLGTQILIESDMCGRVVISGIEGSGFYFEKDIPNFLRII